MAWFPFRAFRPAAFKSDSARSVLSDHANALSKLAFAAGVCSHISLSGITCAVLITQTPRSRINAGTDGPRRR